MVFLYSFLFCGLLCMIGQILFDNTKLTMGHITSLFVVIGALLDIFDIYDKIINIVGGGAYLPITSFGHLLSHGAYSSMLRDGILGCFTGMFELCSAGITSCVLFSFLFTLIFKPKD